MYQRNTTGKFSLKTFILYGNYIYNFELSTSCDIIVHHQILITSNEDFNGSVKLQEIKATKHGTSTQILVGSFLHLIQNYLGN